MGIFVPNGVLTRDGCQAGHMDIQFRTEAIEFLDLGTGCYCGAGQKAVNASLPTLYLSKQNKPKPRECLLVPVRSHINTSQPSLKEINWRA